MNELMQTSWHRLLWVSLVGGVLGGALVLALGAPEKVAQGICLAFMVPISLMGAYCCCINPDIGTSMSLILIMIPLAVAGAYVEHDCRLVARLHAQKSFRHFYCRRRHQNGIFQINRGE
jgi:uncharacterized membrane protein YfcA